MGWYQRRVHGGFGPSFAQNINMHVFWSFGVAHHISEHTSIAILYKTFNETGKYVMLKIDLQAAGEEGDGGDTGDGGKIYILYELKVVDGINTSVWKNKEGVYNMSLNQLFRVFKDAHQQTPSTYSLLQNNCIQFKN